MRNRLLKFVKTNPIQSVLLLLLIGYFVVYACTGSCPLQMMGARMGGTQGRDSGALLPIENEDPAFNLHQRAMDFRLVDGSVINSSTFKGKVTIVNYWATWCGPCVREIPSFNKIAREKAEDLQIVGISVDSEVKAVHQFFNRMPVEYPVAHGDMRLTQLTGPIRSIPTTLFFDSQGNFAGKVVGSMSERELLNKIESL